MTFPSFTLKVFTIFALLFSTTAFGETVLISHDFGGDIADPLNGEDATVFNSAITTAGGSSTWAAANAFKANGSVTAGSSDSGVSARLFLGSYIEDQKGTAAGKFSLTATLNPLSGGGTDFLSLGYFTGPIPLTVDFASDGSSYAIGTALTRVSSNSSDYFSGPKTSNSADVINGTGLRTYTIDFDFTPDGGYNGTSNFGTVTYHSDNDGGHLESFTFTSAKNVQYIGITRDDDVAGNFSNFEFTQIPEPSTFLLMVIAGMGLTVFLRRR